MATLFVVIEEEETDFELKEGENKIGRHPDCPITLAQPSVSGRHAMIHGEGGKFAVEDIGSRNGTFVNEQRVEGRVRLNHNDALRLGSARARFHDPPKQPVAAAKPSSATVADAHLATMDLGAAQVNIDEASGANITGQLAGAGRFGALDVNPEAKLRAVLDISKGLAGTVDLATLLPKILDSLFNVFMYADRGCILLKDEKTGEMVPRAMRHRRKDEDSTVRLSRTIVNKVLSEKTAILSADAATDGAFNGSESIADLRIRSMMCVPLLGLKDEVLGILSIDSQSGLGQFTSDDLDILVTVAGQAALSFENARLAHEYAEKQKQDADMAIAREVQRALLPDEMPTVEGYQFYASYDSARAVGGDLYDFFELSDGKICLSFGDVSGKGVPGALIMTRMGSCVQSTVRHVHDVVKAICDINDHMCSTGAGDRFVTYVLAIVDTKNHEFVLSNAGHMPPIIRRANGTIEQFDKELSGTPIGMFDGYPYEAQTCKLDSGDMVLIMTDGVEEAMNADQEEYGVERVMDVVKNAPPEAEKMGKLLLEDVRRHANGYPQSDDITIMTFGRNP